MVTVAIRALELEYLVKILDWGRSRSRYIFADSNYTLNSFRLRPPSPDNNINIVVILRQWGLKVVFRRYVVHILAATQTILRIFLLSPWSLQVSDT
jgi:hypothetical protein